MGQLELDVRAEDVLAEDVLAEDVLAEDVLAEDVLAEDVLAEDVLADARTSVLRMLECDALIEEIGGAFRAGLFARTCQLARALEPYLEGAGRWADWRSTQGFALAAAIRLGDWEAQGRSQLSIGRACLAMGDVRRGRAQTTEGTLILRALGVMV